MNFELTTIGQYASIQGGYAFKSQDFLPSGFRPVLKIKNVRHGYVDYSDATYVSQDVAVACDKWKTAAGDVLISMTGSGPSAPESLVGRVARIWDAEPIAMINQRVGRLVLRQNDVIDKDFLFYVLSQKESQEYLVLNSTGSANQVNISGKTIESVACPIITFEESREIAEVLSAFDQRIRLLSETNATLEAMAQALFKSWFVDFDPVHANAGTRAATLPAELQALFPSTFTDTPQGLVPEGWKVGTIADAVEIVGGATPDTKNEEFWNPPAVAWTSPKDLSGLNTPVLLDTERKISMKGLAKISSGLLPAGSLLMSSRAPIGYLAIADIPLAINQGYIAMLPGSRLPPLYMLFWCRQNMEVIKSRANGSTFMEISKKAFRPIELILPPAAVIAGFIAMVEPLFQRIVENEKQAQTLAALRDTLLPRLISGQLRLPDAEAALAEAGA